MWPWNEEYYRAFMTLMDSRRPAMSGVSPIPLSETLAYLMHIGIGDVDERERWIRMIRALDSAYVSHVNMRLKRERASKATRPPRR